MQEHPASGSSWHAWARWVCSDLIIVLLLAAGCSRDEGGTSATAHAATTRAAAPRAVEGVVGDWTGFQGSGALRGQASGLARPPLKLKWMYKTSDGERAGVMGSVAIVGSSVYVADDKGTLHALNLADGSVRWKYSSAMSKTADAAAARGEFLTSPLVVGERVFIGDNHGIFHAVSAKDGQRLWTFDAQTEMRSSANVLDLGEKIVFATDGASLFCLKAADGDKVWEADAGDRVNSCPMVAIGGGKDLSVVYTAGCDAMLRAYDAKTGAPLRAAMLQMPSGGSVVLLPDGKGFVVATDGGHVTCYDQSNLAVRWQYTGVEDNAMIYSTPAVDQGIAVVGAQDRFVHAIDLATGQMKWRFRTRGNVDASPVICGDYVYAGSNDRKLYALELKTGREVWSFTAGRGIVAPVAIGRGVLVVGDTGGNVYCFE